MAFKSIALGTIATLGLAVAASADVVQTNTAIQQSDQYQYAEGVGEVLQNSTNVQQLGQRSAVGRRGRRSRSEVSDVSIQQTNTGVQQSVQSQEALSGDRIRQNSVNVNDLIQDSLSGF